MSENNLNLSNTNDCARTTKNIIPNKLMISLLAIIVIIASFNFFNIYKTSITSKSKNEDISNLINKKFGENVTILKTLEDKTCLYGFYLKNGEKNNYGIIKCPRNNFFYNYFSISDIKDSETNNKFGYYLDKENNTSKLVVYGDFTRSTAKSVKANLGTTEKEVEIEENSPNILSFDFGDNTSQDVSISIYDESSNDLSGSLK